MVVLYKIKKLKVELGKWKIIINNFCDKYFKTTFIVILLLTMVSVPQCFAYEDCIITTNGRMNDIKIQHKDIIDVFPLVTIANDKNTIIVHPLKIGETKFSIVIDNKDRFFFDVKITKEKTIIQEKDGFEILTIDCPPKEEYVELDEPPMELELDEPPNLKERRKTSD